MKWSILSLLLLAPLSAAAHSSYGSDPVGLSIWSRDGAIAPLTLVGDHPRYIQELDITDTLPSATDNGIQPVIDSGEFSSLDWRGITLVDEDWRVGLDGTWTRQRFYRNAKWMERDSLFIAFPANDFDQIVGLPIIVFTGKDDKLRNTDSNFIRRFDARQTATGCQAQGDCSNVGVSYSAQALVQLRNAMYPNLQARHIPESATQLLVFWTEDPSTVRSIPLAHAEHSEFDYSYGFEIDLDVVSVPSNGQYYAPGETVSFQLTYRDGDGNPLHSAGSLPTYGQFLRGEIESGLRYVDFSINSTLYYALKHREGNVLLSMAGPTNKLKNSSAVVDPATLLSGQGVSATVAADGYSAVFGSVPSGLSILGGFQVPALWDLPQSDVVNLVIPADALPGTYIVATKARREWGGEALNRSASIEIQVGSNTPTVANLQTGPCSTCHSGASSLGNLLHGTNDRRTCYGCHASLAIEPDNALDIRVHTIHDRSDRFSANINKCSTCHLTPPSGPARGIQ